MPDALTQFFELIVVHPVLASLLALAFLAFIWFFGVPCWRLVRHLRDFRRQISELRSNDLPDPIHIKLTDTRLKHLWAQYLASLHQTEGAVNPKTGARAVEPYRSTLPAEAIFNSQAIFEGRIHTEFFKHLPGLLTGVGIIGTFLGLIDGLQRSTGTGDVVNTSVLISSVKAAFQVSASAIVLAMLITFVEKVAVAQLHSVVERLCQDIDECFSGGVGEEYLRRMVQASEEMVVVSRESASHAAILKDALVGELATILERLTERQIEVSTRQQAALQTQLVDAIDQSLKQPLGRIADGFNSFSGSQGDKITQSLQDSMSAFAAKLEELLGGQVGQAKDLQKQTVQALEAAVLSFQTMAKQVGAAGETATSTMAEQLGRTLDQMATRQGQMNETMRALVDEMRGAAAQAQYETGSNLGRLLEELGSQVKNVVSSLQIETKTTSAAHQVLAADMASHAKQSVDDLAAKIAAQTAAIDQAAQAMRNGVADLGSSVNENVRLMGAGAADMRAAAAAFPDSSKAIADVFERSRTVATELNQTAMTLKASSSDVQSVVGDYRAARETFAGLVDGLRGLVDTAKRDVSMTSDLVGRLEAAAQKLAAAQGQADAYLGQVNEVLEKAHGSFSTQMLKTVRETNTDFEKHLVTSVGLLSGAIDQFASELDSFDPNGTKAARNAA
jgi:methyl-accepting chemotaxis protein